MSGRFDKRQISGVFLLAALLAYDLVGCQPDTHPGPPVMTVVPTANETKVVTTTEETLSAASAVDVAKKADTPVDTVLVEADNGFGFRLFGALARQDSGKNVFISPSSVALALDMVYNGARGETQTGMGMAFTGQADLSGIAPSLQISEVLHKTFVEVSEEGTEAAAATVVLIPSGGMAAPSAKTFDMVVDHPFACAIVDSKTGAVVFLGSIVDPK